jgi:hypothetical protein
MLKQFKCLSNLNCTVELFASAGDSDVNAQVYPPYPCDQNIGYYGPVMESYSHVHVSRDWVYCCYSISGNILPCLSNLLNWRAANNGPSTNFFLNFMYILGIQVQCTFYSPHTLCFSFSFEDCMVEETKSEYLLTLREWLATSMCDYMNQ